jgi:hypothetical protein
MKAIEGIFDYGEIVFLNPGGWKFVNGVAKENFDAIRPVFPIDPEIEQLPGGHFLLLFFFGFLHGFRLFLVPNIHIIIGLLNGFLLVGHLNSPLGNTRRPGRPPGLMVYSSMSMRTESSAVPSPRKIMYPAVWRPSPLFTFTVPSVWKTT